MALDIKKLPCIHAEDFDDEFFIDLTKQDLDGKAWHLKLPEGEKGHEYVGCTAFHRGGAAQSLFSPDEDFLVISLFVPTPGRSEMRDGNISVSWELHPQQLDFLIAYFEAMDKGEVSRPLVINFCDESPKLKDILPQIYSCMQLFDIAVDKVILSGMNFAGQREVNMYAKKENVDPLKYVTMWNMSGHMDLSYIEKRLARHNGFDDGEIVEYKEPDEEFWQVKQNTFTFLNRRYAPIRAIALWSLYLAGSWKYKSIVTAFPPVKYFRIGSSDSGVTSYFTEDYFRGILKSTAPTMRNELTTDSFNDFIRKYNFGKTLPGDHSFIGGVESRYAPRMEESYLWYSIETVADQKERNIFFTEKFLKPMMYGQGLIAYAQPGMIETFKQLGFYTLAEELGFSEEYDSVEDNEKRMKMISKEITKLCQVPLLDMHERWLTAKPKILHNQKMIATQLTNLRNLYWDRLCESTNNQLREPYNADALRERQTTHVIEEYQKFLKYDSLDDNYYYCTESKKWRSTNGS